MVEVHNQPELALSDSAQALTPSQYLQLVAEVRAIHELFSCGHGPAGRLGAAESDRPQAGGYNFDEMDLKRGSAKHATADR